MINKKLFYLPTAVLAALSIVGLVVFNSVLSTWLSHFMQDEFSAQLDDLVNDLQLVQPEPNPSGINQYLNRHGALKNLRLTVIASDGRVLADSELPIEDTSKLANHGDRPEIQAALAQQKGFSTRYSDTLGLDMLYLAKPVSYSGFEGVMRLSTPMGFQNGIVFKLTVMIAGLMGVIVVLMVGISHLITRHIQQHLEREQSMLETHVRNRTREIELLQRLANMLAACNSLTEAQQVVEDVIPRILGDINGAVFMMRSSRNQLEVKLDWGGKWPGAQAYAPDECWALRKGKYHLANDHFTKLPCAHMTEVRDDQTLCIPLIAHGNTIGMMHLYIAEQDMNEERMQLAFTICEHLGLALANLSLQEKLREQAIRDPLTGLHNRRYLEESMNHELMRSQRHNQAFSILMLDMDHFKLFNDNFGHDAGDYVLKALATTLNNSVRGEDIVCRVGGEELAVVLPATDALGAVKAGETLCEQVRNLHLAFHGASLGKLTISIGVATYPVDADDGAGLLKQADVALYAAKEAGRDQCLHCNPQMAVAPEKTDKTKPATITSLVENDSPQETLAQQL